MLFTCTLDMALDLAYDYMSVGSIVYAGQDEVENADWYPMLDGYDALKLDAHAGRAEVEANAEAMACLAKLAELSNAGERIAVATDGEDKYTDVRSVFAAILRDMGADVCMSN